MLPIINANQTQSITERLLKRGEGDFSAQEKIVEEIIANIASKGDEALFEYTKKFDNFNINEGNICVSKKEIEDAYTKVPKELVEIIKEAGKNIEEFHNMQKRKDWFLEQGGKILGQLYIPVESVGVYVPGGKAAYPSSVLMNIIPAKCAGVENIYVATPAVNGKVSETTIVSADIAGADKIYKIGGAQAVASFAYGTKSVPKVDKITGPGNIYVALAKKRVYGQVGIDMIAGPSEVLIVADKFANEKYIAADFLSQAEHDELAACVLVTDNLEFAKKVSKEIEKQANNLPKKEIVMKSLNNYGTIIIAKDVDDAIRVANIFAPEHMEVCVQNPKDYLHKIKNAGSIFLGEYSPEPLGDYFAGTNHVLPTNGTARFSSPLNVDDFQKKSSVIYYSKEEFEKVYKKIEKFALSEGLDAHARSAKIRFEGIE